MPTTVAPLILAIWPATLPVAPAAPDTTTSSPGWGSAMRAMPTQAVRLVMPSAESMSAGPRSPGYSDAGSKRPAGTTAYWVQPATQETTSPGRACGFREARTRQAVRPRIVSPIWTGGM